MSSHEHIVDRPHVTLAPDDKTGGDLGILAESKKPQQTSGIESSLPIPQTPVEGPLDTSSRTVKDTHTEDNEFSTLAQAAQSLAVPMEPSEKEATEIAGTIDLSSDQASQTRREARHTHWKQAREIPPIAGGSSSSAGDRQMKRYLQLEEKWKGQAIELGLPENVTYEAFLAHRDMKRRKEIAESVKWRLEPRITKKAERLGDDPYPGWETILYYALNVTGPEALVMTPEELAERITLVRKMLSKMDKEKQQKR